MVVTGHRPERIPDEKLTREAIQSFIRHQQPDLVIQGMAAGVDVWTAAAAWKENIPFLSARPWATHKSISQKSQDWVLRNSDSVHIVVESNSYPGVWVYETRNRWMVDNSDFMLAVWDGDPHGGTMRAIRYARSKNLPIFRLNPTTSEITEF